MGSGGIALFLTSVEDGGEWSASCPCRFTSEKWYPLDRRLGGPQSRSGRYGEEENPLHLSGIEPQAIAHRSTD
jgi:hypothetical protein